MWPATRWSVVCCGEREWVGYTFVSIVPLPRYETTTTTIVSGLGCTPAQNPPPHGVPPWLLCLLQSVHVESIFPCSGRVVFFFSSPPPSVPQLLALKLFRLRRLFTGATGFRVVHQVFLDGSDRGGAKPNLPCVLFLCRCVCPWCPFFWPPLRQLQSLGQGSRSATSQQVGPVMVTVVPVPFVCNADADGIRLSLDRFKAFLRVYHVSS